VTNLYEAGDINTVDGDDQVDINSSDDTGNDVEGNEPNEAFDGGTPLAVLSYLARSLSNEPDAVVIDSEERRGGVRLSLHVAPDRSPVPCRRGRTAQAIRTLVNVAGAKDGVQASVDIVDD
jgi:predicted RNA-binding protein YlqC (UPF0109 family)